MDQLEKVQPYITDELTRLRSLTLSDFSALACIEKSEGLLRWKYVSGNLNCRYKNIAMRSGRGLAGLVIRHGRSIILDASIPDFNRKLQEEPIMLAEHLQSAIAVPIMMHQETAGVLLVGNRSRITYSFNEIQLVLNIAERFAIL